MNGAYCATERVPVRTVAAIMSLFSSDGNAEAVRFLGSIASAPAALYDFLSSWLSFPDQFIVHIGWNSNVALSVVDSDGAMQRVGAK